MTAPTDEHKDLSPQDAEFVERLATHFAPAALTPKQRAAFDMALEARLEKRRRRTFFVPAFATVAAAAAVLIFTFNGGIRRNPQTPSSGEPILIVAEAPIESGSSDSLARDEWEYDLLAFNDPMAYVDEPNELNELDETNGTDEMYALDGSGEDSEKDVFPDEYLAIESVFLEG